MKTDFYYFKYNIKGEIRTNAKSIRSMICVYLKSGQEFRYKLRLVGEEISEKKRLVGSMRADLKEIMTRKMQLERRIQPMVCDLQKLEDQHQALIESLIPKPIFDLNHNCHHHNNQHLVVNNNTNMNLYLNNSQHHNLSSLLLDDNDSTLD